MEAYTSFAEVYDVFMDNVPYKKWADYLEGILKEEGIENGLVLELGCGTGNMTEELANRGYDMIGVDNAEEMLEIAMKKKEKSGHDILYLLQDMQEVELYGTVRAIVEIRRLQKTEKIAVLSGIIIITKMRRSMNMSLHCLLRKTKEITCIGNIRRCIIRKPIHWMR